MNQREIANRNTHSAECRIVEVAKRLATQVKMTSQIPPDYDPGKQRYGQVLAEIRHEFTNYEQLLHELPICVDHRDAGGECAWDAERELECPLEKEAHDIMKGAAKDVAEAEYRRWQEQYFRPTDVRLTITAPKKIVEEARATAEKKGVSLQDYLRACLTRLAEES